MQERINAKHQETREKQARMLWDLGASHAIEEDDMDPNYARINHFKEPPPNLSSQRPYSPPMAGAYSYTKDQLASFSEGDHVQDLYAKIHRKHQVQEDDRGHPASGNVDCIQQLRMEYHQAKRDGFYEVDNVVGQPLEYEQTWELPFGPTF
ncbi:partitioning defective 3 homolog B-like [Hyperolius riggenbachi]|uniref:partitioning defective 3 homolog B-like n=1 Tax=Hyperolius riggenbachi TaxID=752182 RepID=UPI0035A2F71E